MFSPDVVSLRQYYSTPLGIAMHALITHALTHLWPGAKGDVIMGIGYATPYLGPFLNPESPVMAAMPAQQGAAYWPPEHKNVVFLSHESELPMPDNSINRILLVHSVENSEQLSGMMEEIWRVLTPGGRVLAVVPNRMGFWSRSSRSPFGYGRPFSMAQLRDLMTDHRLTPTHTGSALFIPPLHLRLLWRVAPAIEMIGRFICPFIGGVLLLEAEKQLYASIREPVFVRKMYRIPIRIVKPAMGMRRHKNN
jgi:SAM-dependent methyltransferase